MGYKLTTLIFVLIISITECFSQEKILKIEDAFNRDIYPERINQLVWRSGNTFTYVEKNNLVEKQPGDVSGDTILSFDLLKNLISITGLKEIKGFPKYDWIDINTIEFEVQRHLFHLNINTHELKDINNFPEDAEGMEIAPETFYMAYTRENNLFISVDGKEKAITKDHDKGIKNGQTVHRSEFGISDGIFWSPNGNFLAFYRKDETMVSDYPLVNIDSRSASLENTKYPMAGEISEEVSIAVYNVKTGKTLFLKTDNPKDTYFTNITWTPDEKQIYISQLNRDQNHLKMNVFDAGSGKFLKTIFEEKNEKYVEPEQGPLFLPNDPSKFIWLSERDGWNHMYLYDTDGKQIRQLTKGNWMVTDILEFDISTNLVYFISTQKSPIERQLYSVNINSGEISQLTSEAGTHNISFSKDKKLFIDQYSNIEIPAKYQIVSSNGKVNAELLTSKNRLEGYNTGKTEIFTIKALDNTELFCRMIKPVNFDPSRKYPVLVYVYGGPHDQLVRNSWLGGSNIWFQYLASKGYIVWTLDNRGSANRGFDFESAIFRNCGGVEVDDQMAGVNYLKSLPYVDTARIGVDGWSYGGFVSLSLMLKNPGVFKVATAGGPVVDWKWYEVMYGERYMDTPQSNAEGYEKSSLLNYVKNLTGRVLVIHGTMDGTVVWQHSLSFVKKCIEEGKLVDYMVYPGHEHNVGGKDRIHLWKKLEQYYSDNL